MSLIFVQISHAIVLPPPPKFNKNRPSKVTETQ